MTLLPIDISVQEVEAMLGQPDVVLIDCREQSEWDIAHIDGAILFPMSQWQQVSGKLAEYADKRLVVHCHHGGRSARVTQWLRENGYTSAQNMQGGIDQWSLEVDTSVPRY